MDRIGHFLGKKGMEAQQAIFLAKLVRNRFNISRACRALPIARQTFYNWRKKAKFNQKYIESIEERLDLLEEALFVKAVFGRDTRAQIFLCKTILKKRGYCKSG